MRITQRNAPVSKLGSALASTMLEDSLGVGLPEPLHNAQGVHATAAVREDYVGQLSNHVAQLANIAPRNPRKLRGQKHRHNSEEESCLWPRSGPVNKRNNTSPLFLPSFHANPKPRSRSAEESFLFNDGLRYRVSEVGISNSRKWV